MSVSNDYKGTILEFCAKVRNSDPSILPELGKPFMIRHLTETEGTELADALLENNSITYLELETGNYTKCCAEAMAKYVRTSKRLQRIRWSGDWGAVIDDRELMLRLRHREDMLFHFLPAIQESASLEELNIDFPLRGGPSYLALESMLTHTQSLRSLSLICPDGPLEDRDVAAASSGLKQNTTLRELTLKFAWGATTVSPLLTSLRDHPLLRRLCLRGHVRLAGLETLLLSDTSKITELEINGFCNDRPVTGLADVLQALARRPTLTKLGLRRCVRGHDEARLLRMALCNIPSLQSLDLASNYLGSAELAELAPALYHNSSIKVLDISENNLIEMDSTILLRDILRSNKTMAALDLSGNTFGLTAGAVECIADGLGSSSTLLKIGLSNCRLGDDGVSILAQTLGSRNTTLQKVTLCENTITSTSVGVLLRTMEQNSHIKDIGLQYNPIGSAGASLLARSLGNNALPNLTRLSLHHCGIGDDGFIALVSALEQNTSLLQLDLCSTHGGFSGRAFSALAKSLSEIKVLQQADFRWCTGLVSAMPLLLAGLRKNTSLFRFRVTGCAPSLVPPTPRETARCAGGWIQEMEWYGYRNRLLPLVRAPKERLPPLGVWPHALARVAALPDVIFELLRSKPSLVPSDVV
jgi:Leucine-rich repeat (LRR) protein